MWKPGEHNGTFRGNNHAFVTATTALRHFWSDDKFAEEVRRKGKLMMKRLDEIAGKYSEDLVRSKGRGMMCGLTFATGELAGEVTQAAFDMGLVIETSGPEDQVVKCLAPLVISEEDMLAGLDIIERATDQVLVAAREKADRAVA